MKLAKVALATTLLISANSYAVNISFEDKCEIELNRDLAITPKHILIQENDETIVDIYQDEMLFIRGNQVELSDKEAKLLKRYSTSIRQSVPEVAELAVEAVEIAFDGINTALGQFADMQQTEEKFDQIKDTIRAKFNRADGHYNFSNGNFTTSMDGSGIDQMAEELVEDMVPQIVGGVLANIGAAIAKGEANFEDLENLDEKIERAIEGKAEKIEEKAERFCGRLKEVDEIEDSLIASNRQLVELDLISIK